MRPVWPALAVALLSIAPASAQVLSGQISSSEEGAMEGVVVSARKVGATTTISVVSDADGKFSFPPAKIESGRYNLRIRAVGFELDGPRSVEVGADTASIALTLKKTDNLAAQLTSSEWFMSFPGTREQKNFLDRCTSCHTYERIAKSSYNADEFIPVLQRMGRYAQAARRSSRTCARMRGQSWTRGDCVRVPSFWPTSI